jgi:hypothetical protein
MRGSVDVLIGERSVRLSLLAFDFSSCWRGRDRIGPIGPSAEVDQAAPLRAEGERGEVADRGDREGLRTDRTPPLDHQAVPFGELFEPEEDGDDAGVEDEGADEDDPELPESLFEPPDSPLAPPELSPDDFSALAAFLYESLR